MHLYQKGFFHLSRYMAYKDKKDILLADKYLKKSHLYAYTPEPIYDQLVHKKSYDGAKQLYFNVYDEINTEEKADLMTSRVSFMLKLKDPNFMKINEIVNKAAIINGKMLEVVRHLKSDKTINFSETDKRVNELNVRLGETADEFSKVVDEIANQTYSQSEIILIAFAGLAVGIGLLLSYIFSRSITKPIEKTMIILEIISQGDFREKLDIKSKDEMGMLAEYQNKVISITNDMIQQIKSVISNTKNISEELTANSEESAAALEEMAAGIENINESTIRLDDDIHRSLQYSSTVKQFIGTVKELLNTQSSAISESSSSIGEMSASIQSIAKSSSEKIEKVTHLEETALENESQMKESVEIIAKVAESANVIMEMISVINGIADQTNLLAMNAAIEAAHAGDSGRGFAVVADEIRKLAESTATNSKEISKSLKDIISYIHTSEESIGKIGNSYSAIVTDIKDISLSMTETQSAMSELSDGSQQVIQSLASLLNVSEQVNSSSVDMEGRVEGLVDTIDSFGVVSSEVKTGMEEIVSRITELKTTAENISVIGIKNNDGVINLESLIYHFKTDEKSKSLVSS